MNEFSIDRRALVTGLGALTANCSGLLSGTKSGDKALAREAAGLSVQPFEFDDVIRRARDLAAAPFDSALPPLPAELAQLDYDAYRDIRFKPAEALLAGNHSLFRLHMFHLGFLFKRPVNLNIIRNGVAARIPYSSKYFDYGHNRFPSPLPRDLGYAGFRLHFPLNTPNYYDEVIAFLGTSYFRFLGRTQLYGLSARGLAINAGGPEEFPFFREFWIEYPAPEAQNITIYALLDSPSGTGAYRFDLQPQTETILDVSMTLFARTQIVRLGIAPLTSMFYLSRSGKRNLDFRPEVHDSDGLQILTRSGEWIWRPLRNPDSMNISSFMDGDARGFGLMQRDRNIDDYEDLEAHYERRPSYWIEPRGNWGDGHIELVELPTDVETNENIVSFWTPKIPVEAGQSLKFAYRMTSLVDDFKLNPGGVALNTFLTKVPKTAQGTGLKRRYLVDFSRGDLAFYLNDPAAVEIVAATSAGQVTAQLRPNPHIEGFRATIDISLDPGQSADISAYLKCRTKRLTETWTMLWAN